MSFVAKCHEDPRAHPLLTGYEVGNTEKTNGRGRLVERLWERILPP